MSARLQLSFSTRYTPAPERNSKHLNKDNLQAQLFDHAHRLLKTHETLLRDTVRNRKFDEALKRRVSAGCSVLDIGAGTGIWAIAAAKLGAGRVVAVDMDELLVGAIRMLADEHGVADRVEAICANSFDLDLARDFDVVISETIGFLGYDERIIEVMADARKRFLREDGHMIPEKIALYAAAGKLNGWIDTIPTGVDLDFEKLTQLNLNSPRVLKRSRDVRLSTRPARMISTDLRRANSTPNLRELGATWDLPSDEDIDCVIVWVESRLAPGVRLSTRRTTSWRPTVYRIAPPRRRFARMEFSLSLTHESNYWTASFADGESRESRSYSPEFAATEMIAAARGTEVFNTSGHLVLAQEHRPPLSIELRDTEPNDEEFLRTLYHTRRREEVSAFGWSEEEQDSFLTMQFEMQRNAYSIQYPNAEHRIILCDGVPAGRIVIDRLKNATSLTDIAVLPAFRGRGIASQLIARLKTESAKILLHVDRQNLDARRLYEKLGFVPTSENELGFEMTWTLRT